MFYTYVLMIHNKIIPRSAHLAKFLLDSFINRFRVTIRYNIDLYHN